MVSRPERSTFCSPARRKVPCPTSTRIRAFPSSRTRVPAEACAEGRGPPEPRTCTSSSGFAPHATGARSSIGISARRLAFGIAVLSEPEVGLADPRVGDELAGRALLHQRSVLDDVAAIGDLQTLHHLLLHDEHGDLLGALPDRGQGLLA